MDTVSAEPGSFAVGSDRRVSRLYLRPADARACIVLAHGAGAGMTHTGMTAVANGLGGRGVATFRYQFPYMEAGSRRPDRPPLCHVTVRAAVSEAAKLASDLPLFAGGRSFGGRMTSQAQAVSPLPHVRGLIFLAFPLHAAGQPSSERGEHLEGVNVPMLFLQGSRDALAERARMETLCAKLGPLATLRTIEDADHSFRVPARSGRSNAAIMAEVLEALVGWVDAASTQAPRA